MSNFKQREINLQYGRAHLTSEDIKECRQKLKGIIIAPYDESKAKGIGYNLSLSEMIYSITRERLVPICKDAQEVYFYLHPNETVLALSHEHVMVDDGMAGSFHSRVRTTAQGIGCISTTLDPGWKGMLIFSLNNPTKKKLKVVLSKNVDGKISTSAVVTLVVWKTERSPVEEDNKVNIKQTTLQLDNPPMRLDIWSELTIKKVKFFNDHYYQSFCRLVEKLSKFETELPIELDWTKELSDLLTKLRIAIKVNKSEQEIRTILIMIQDYRNIPEAMKKRLSELEAVLNTDNFLRECQKKEYMDNIDLCKKEIEYQLLCNQVSQIHEIIEKNVPISWHKTRLANIKHYFVKNIFLVLATGISVILLVLGRNTQADSFGRDTIICMMPLFASAIVEWFKNKK